jgi:DNA relaxase NicK
MRPISFPTTLPARMQFAERAARREAEAVAARVQAVNSHSEALIARLRLEIEKLKRDIHGSRSERKARLLEQMELQLEELEANASEDELAAEMAARSSAVVNAAANFPKSAEVKFPNYADGVVTE